MITVNIGSDRYSFPTKWEEVDIERILPCSTPTELVQAAGKIPPDLMARLNEAQIFNLYAIIDFIDDPDSLNEVIDSRIECVSVNESKWGTFEDARKSVSSELYKTLFRLCKIYHPDEKKTVRQLSIGFKLINEINVFLSVYEEMFNDKPDPQEEQAGVDELTKFGTWATAYNLAGEDILKIDAILARPAVEVYTALYYSWTKSKFQKRLMEIRNPKK